MSSTIREIHQTGPYCYTYSPFHPPVATVQPGEKVAIHTVDAFGDFFAGAATIDRLTISVFQEYGSWRRTSITIVNIRIYV